MRAWRCRWAMGRKTAIMRRMNLSTPVHYRGRRGEKTGAQAEAYDAGLPPARTRGSNVIRSGS